MLNRPVTTISARKRGTTRFLIGSTPSTWSASSSSRILRAPRSAVIAVPPTPAVMMAVTVGANSRIEASTKKPPSRSIAPNRTRKLPAWSPGAPYPNAIVEIVSGSQQSRSMNRNCWTNSVPYGYGGRNAETSVLPVRIIMSPTCSSRFLVGRKTLSAVARITVVDALLPGRAAARPTDGGSLWHAISRRQMQPRTRRTRAQATPPVVCSPGFEAAPRVPADRRARGAQRLRRRRAPGRERARGRLPGRGRARELPGRPEAREELEAPDHRPQRRQAHHPERGPDDRRLRLQQEGRRRARGYVAPGLRRRRRAGPDRRLARGEGSDAPRLRHRLREHLGLRSAAPRPRAHLRVVGDRGPGGSLPHHVERGGGPRRQRARRHARRPRAARLVHRHDLGRGARGARGGRRQDGRDGDALARTQRFSPRRSYPGQRTTGNRGYLGKRSSVRERRHMLNALPRVLRISF